ncbi:RNA-binding protein [Planococcus plakortidis]|uniref:RNA-binding protein n=4 Tax=Planococcus TaxID=1372 RepID=A0A0U2N5P1_9BACL|nr:MULTISPECIES: S4 domain-containing protein YaaA [Planococcus]MDE4086624.1 S4 domain-containing protein YaaA [Planococcus maritimus]ALS75561.1 RNA-binding protein [Planococcus rifietoensis]ANU20822.1 RNA-binding protein [Planococcus plakortidis]AUD12514.1 S4 domain-containing protein YaaA [Planococcus sp. MB-3u-03]PKG46392.1 S4 domain-containing protein YaaA [Planococcus sp. Urea-trap-24]
MKEIGIETEFITLGQLLKMTDTISSGGMAKWFLSEHEVFVNGEAEDRRGRKLRPEDTVNIPGTGEFRIVVAEGMSFDAD